MRMAIKRGIPLLLMSLLVCGIARQAPAGLLRVESQSLFSARNGEDQRAERPMYEFMEGSYVSSRRDLEVNTNFGVFADPLRSASDFNLYLMDVAYSPIPDLVTVRAGRSFNVRTSLRTTTTDSVGADWAFFEKRVKAGAELGVERKRLRTSLDTASNFAGGHVSYRSASLYPLFLGTKYTFRRPAVQPAANQHLVSLAAQKPLPGRWSPELLSNVEISADPGRLNLGEAGLDLYPSYRTALRWRALIYDVRPTDDHEEPIFTIFSMGRLYETSVQAEHQFVPSFSSSLTAAYDDYLLQERLRTSGYRLELGSRFSRRFLTVSNAAYFVKSYGGEVLGDRLSFMEELSDRVQLDQISDVTYYQKVTSSKRYALNFEGRLGVWLWDRFKLNTGLEFNNNNSSRYDFRAVAKLTYLLWKEI